MPVKKNLLICIFLIPFLYLNIHAQKTDVSHVPEKGFYSERPARKWEESLVTGNGEMGAMVAGGPFKEKIVFNHALLYLPLYPTLKPVSQGDHLEEIRQLTLEGKYSEASQLVVELSHTEGYGRKRATDPFIPAFQLNVIGDSTKTINYSRTVDFTSGEVEVKWQDKNGVFSRKLFVSRPDNVIAMKLTSDNGAPISNTFNLSQILNASEKRLKKFELDDNLGISKVESKASKEGLTFRVWYEKAYRNGYAGYSSYEGYEGVVKIMQTGGTVEIKDNNFIVNGASEIILLSRISPSENMQEPNLTGLFTQLNGINSDYDQLLKKHKAVHNELFSRVSIDLGATAEDKQKSSEELLKEGGTSAALIEKLFDASRYNVICATGINPPNLLGIWGASMTPNWSGTYTTNGNLPVVVSHNLQANTPELMLPLFNRFGSFMDDFKVNAWELFHCKGIHVPAVFTTHGLNNHFDANWTMTFWTAGAAWYSMFYYDYYLYTLDKEFLKNRALPFMEQSVLFYEEFLQEGPDGKFIFNPSYSPENHPFNSKSQTCINATMDVMAANGLLRSLIEASRILGVNSEKIPVWEKMLNKMPAYQLNEQGEIKEWMWDNLQDNHNHRHASHLWGLYDLHDPLIMNNPELIEACKKTIESRMEIRRENKGGIMAFGLIQLGFSATALCEVETAYDILTWLGTNYWNNNLVSTHDPHNIFNVDICGGYPSLVMKMLYYSEPGMVSFLQCVPKEWPTGNVKGIALRGGIVMNDMIWNGNEVQATLVSKIDQTIKIRIRGQEKEEVELKAGKPVKVSY